MGNHLDFPIEIFTLVLIIIFFPHFFRISTIYGSTAVEARRGSARGYSPLSVKGTPTSTPPPVTHSLPVAPAAGGWAGGLAGLDAYTSSATTTSMMAAATSATMTAAGATAPAPRSAQPAAPPPRAPAQRALVGSSEGLRLQSPLRAFVGQAHFLWIVYNILQTMKKIK